MGQMFKPAQYLEWPGFILVAIGAIFFSFFMIVRGKLVKEKEKGGFGLSPELVTAAYCLISGILFFIASFLFSPPVIWSVLDPQIGIFQPLFWTCILNIAVQFGQTKSQQNADTSLVSAIGAFQPLISIIPAWLVLREAPTAYGYCGLFVIVAGFYIMSLSYKIKDPSKVPAWAKTPEGKLRFTAPIASLFTNSGVRWAFGAASAGAVSVNFDKKAAMLSSYLFAPAVILVFVGLVALAKSKQVEWQTLEKKSKHLLAAAGALYFITNVLYWRAFRFGLAIFIGSLKRLHTIFVLPLSYFILKEAVTKDKKYWMGILIFVAGLFLFTIH